MKKFFDSLPPWPWIFVGFLGPSIVRVLWDQTIARLGCEAPDSLGTASQTDYGVMNLWLVLGLIFLGVNWFLRYFLWWKGARDAGMAMWDNVTKRYFWVPFAWALVWCVILPLAWWLLGCLVDWLVPNAIYRPCHRVYLWIVHTLGPLWDRFWNWFGPAALKAFRFILDGLVKLIMWGVRHAIRH